MAIAKATCTCATCGQQFEVRVVKYNSREARSFEKWAEENITECRDCENKRIAAKHEEENAKATEAAKNSGWPELEGTEKQTAWANTIRDTAVKTISEYAKDSDNDLIRFACEGYQKLLLTHKSASWWIDNRNRVYSIMSVRDMLLQTEGYIEFNKLLKAIRDGETKLEDAKADKEADQPKREPEKAVRPEAVPENRTHEGSADIHVHGETVTAAYDKDETFRTIVKDMGFIWTDGRWKRTAMETSGTADNIVAELGSKLLNKGFAVRFDTQELMEKAVTGDYEPMCRRWIKKKEGGFLIVWGESDDHYRAAKSIPGARYDKPYVFVPERSWEAVEDYARKYGYRITQKAQELMDTLSGAAKAVTPSPAKAPVYNETNVLESSREVLEDLKD